VNDDFEDSSVGQSPACFGNASEQKGRIRVTDETAAAGKKCLKFTDAPGMKSFYPYMFDRAVRYESGTITFSFDIKNSTETPGEARILFRDHHTPRDPAVGVPDGHSYVEGPVVTLRRDGSLDANGKRVASIPNGRWAHIRVSFELGHGRASHYALEAQLQGQAKVKTATHLPFASPHFTVLTGIFVLANLDPVNTQPVFYVDNLELAHSAPRTDE